jgi:2-C-methyl-D-erythritol 4-phosphate cytidylyltransferase
MQNERPAGNAAVVTAAGSSRRMGGSGKKEYQCVCGKPVLVRAVLPFLETGLFFRIVITVPQGHREKAAEILRGFMPMERICFMEGGETRQRSVLSALSALADRPPSVVLIHDGARPWVSAALITRVLESAELFGACVPVIEVPEAVKETGDSGLVIRHFRRDTLRFAQTPQGFLFDRIFAAHQKAAAEGARCVDDAEVYGLYAGAVASVAGDIANRKITYPRDLKEA